MGEEWAAAAKQPPTARISTPGGFGILVSGATSPGRRVPGADRGQGGKGGCQLCPGPSGAQARTAPRAAPAAQHQQEADSFPQVEMVAPGQCPVPARVPRQLRTRRQRHGREVHRVVALGLHGTARMARAGARWVGQRGSRDRWSGPGVPIPGWCCARSSRPEGPARAGNRGNEPGTETRRGRSRAAGPNDWRDRKRKERGVASKSLGDLTAEERGQAPSGFWLPLEAFRGHYSTSLLLREVRRPPPAPLLPGRCAIPSPFSYS